MLLTHIGNNLHTYRISINGLVEMGIIDEYGAAAISWMPDNKHFIFYISNDDGHDYLDTDIYMSDIYCDSIYKMTMSDTIFEGKGIIVGNKLVFKDLRNSTFFL